MGAKVTGLSVAIASRIMAAAAPGEVLVSSTVRDLTTGSSLTFDDRGVRELKGVPGEWHVYAVERAATEPARRALRRPPANAARRPSGVPGHDRSGSAGRASSVATALGLAVVLATGGLLVSKPWQPPALASVTENSIGIIDPARDEVVGQIPVGTRPGGIAVDEGSPWVTNTGDDTVSQIDLAQRSGSSAASTSGARPRASP